MNPISRPFSECIELLKQLSKNEDFASKVEKAIEIFSKALKDQKKIITAGNGGSICDAIHFAEELTGRYCKDRPSLPAIAITDPGHITCTGNDYGYDAIFSRYIEGLGTAGDIFLGISTSGNSKNIIRATEMAKQKGMTVIGFLGKDGGQLKEIVDLPIIVPSSKTERIQEIHTKLVHICIEGIEKAIFGDL